MTPPGTGYNAGNSGPEIGMVDRVLPTVRLLIPCQEAQHDAGSGEVAILNPWSVMGPPDGIGFPFDADEIWVYAQITDGVGTFRLAVEVRQVYDDERPDRVVGLGGAVTLNFPGGGQLAVYDVVFRIATVPFDEPGLYEFRVLAGDGALEGHTVTVRLLDVGAQRWVNRPTDRPESYGEWGRGFRPSRWTPQPGGGRRVRDLAGSS